MNIDGKMLTASDLRPGMKISSTKIVDEPMTVFSQDVVIVGTAPKK